MLHVMSNKYSKADGTRFFFGKGWFFYLSCLSCTDHLVFSLDRKLLRIGFFRSTLRSLLGMDWNLECMYYAYII